MASRKCIVMLGDSNMSGLAALSDVPAADFYRWASDTWGDYTFPAVDTTAFPGDVTITDVKVLQPNVPHTTYDERRITAVGAANSSLTLSGATLASNKRDAWIYVSKNTTGYGVMVRISADPSGGFPITVSDPFAGTFAIAANGYARIIDKSHTIASVSTDSSADTTTITKTANTADFTAVAGDWITIAFTGLGTLSAWHLTRRVVSSTALTVTVSPALTASPAANDCIVEQTAANTVGDFADLSTTANFAFRDLRFLAAADHVYMGAADFPTYLTLTWPAPYSHMQNDRINGLPEATWWIKGHVDGPLYVVIEGMGGASATSSVASRSEFADSDYRIGHQIDLKFNDFRAGSPNGLYETLTAKLDAAQAIAVLANDTLDVIGILSNVGTNDATIQERVDGYGETMRALIASLRSYIYDAGMTTYASADRIPFGLTTVNASLAQRPFKVEVNAIMDEIAADTPAVFVVDATDFGLGDDDLHLNAAGQIAWGRAFYDGWLPLYKDHTTLVAEDGTGLETANSYCTLDEANTFHRVRNGNPATWSSATVAVRNDALRQAALALDATYGSRWVGTRYTSEQALDWPRSYAYDAAGNTLDDTVPTALKDAAALLAYEVVAGNTILPKTETSAAISSESKAVGPINKSTTYIGGKPTTTQYPAVRKVLSTAGLITGGGYGWGTAAT